MSAQHCIHQQIRILLVDDHGLFRESLSRLLEAEPDFQVIGSFGNAHDAVEALTHDPADIVLLDYDLGAEHGTAFVENARSNGFRGRILMVTAGMSDADTLRAFESSLSGIFLKHSPPERLVEAIHRVINGERWIDSGALQSLVAGARGRAGNPEDSRALSSRERSVLKALMEGLTNKEIAHGLGITETSVKWAVQQLFDKLGVRTRSQLVRIALEQGAQDW